jgi:hypothetical protein
MRALVVYESMFGNTQAVANAVAGGLASGFAVEVVEAGSAPRVLPAGVELLVVGGPTHAFGMTRPGTRRSAAEQTGQPLVSAGTGVREWLAAVDRARAGQVAAAAFDTRVDRPRLPGSAARAARRRLRRAGFRIAAPAESFYVTGGSPGQLSEGELARARRWGEQLAAALPHGTRT